jgi:hypothetical protein
MDPEQRSADGHGRGPEKKRALASTTEKLYMAIGGYDGYGAGASEAARSGNEWRGVARSGEVSAVVSAA